MNITTAMKTKSKNNVALYTILLFALLCEIGFCSETPAMKFGGSRKLAQNNPEVEGIGRFAVQQFNRNSNSLLEFSKVLAVKEQVVAGKIYDITLEVSEKGQKSIYEAKVWVKPWLNSKQLEKFTLIRGKYSSATPNLAVIRA